MIELDFTRFPVLVVDDEQDNLDAFRFVFRKSFTLHYARVATEALSMLEHLDPAVIVTDQRMPGMSGIELLREALRQRPDAVGVLLTAYTDLPVLLEAINSGAVYRYVQKPWDSKELTIILRQSIERFLRSERTAGCASSWLATPATSRTEQRDPIDFGELTAESPAMQEAVARLEQLALSTSPVIIAGEPGTEKDLFARALHVGSSRESLPFVVVSCPRFPGDALERRALWLGEGSLRRRCDCSTGASRARSRRHVVDVRSRPGSRGCRRSAVPPLERRHDAAPRSDVGLTSGRAGSVITTSEEGRHASAATEARRIDGHGSPIARSPSTIFRR